LSEKDGGRLYRRPIIQLLVSIVLGAGLFWLLAFELQDQPVLWVLVGSLFCIATVYSFWSIDAAE